MQPAGQLLLDTALSLQAQQHTIVAACASPCGRDDTVRDSAEQVPLPSSERRAPPSWRRMASCHETRHTCRYTCYPWPAFKVPTLPDIGSLEQLLAHGTFRMAADTLGVHTCGMTTSQVSMETRLKPSCSAASTSAAAPWLNHSVRMRRMSCRLSPEPAPAAAWMRGQNSGFQNTASGCAVCPAACRPTWRLQQHE